MIKYECVKCKKDVSESCHWTGDMFRWTKKNKRNRTDGFRFIVLCDDCFQLATNKSESIGN